MDEHLGQHPDWSHGRLFEKIWYVGTDEPPSAVQQCFSEVLTTNDTFTVTTPPESWWESVMFDNADLQRAVRRFR